MKATAIFLLCLVLPFTVQAQQVSLRVISWDLESGDSDANTLKDQFVGKKDVAIWGLTEVPDSNFMSVIESGVEAATGRQHTTVMSTNSGRDKLAIMFDETRVELVGNAFELFAVQLDNQRLRPAFVGQFRGKSTGQEFFFLVAHLQERPGSRQDERRVRQSKIINDFAETKQLPVLAVGNFSFNYDISVPGGNSVGFDELVKDDVFQWIEPDRLVPTQSRQNVNVVQDFIFVANPLPGWEGSSVILNRDGDEAAVTPAFSEDKQQTDHRPVSATFLFGHEDRDDTIEDIQDEIRRLEDHLGALRDRLSRLLAAKDGVAVVYDIARSRLTVNVTNDTARKIEIKAVDGLVKVGVDSVDTKILENSEAIEVNATSVTSIAVTGGDGPDEVNCQAVTAENGFASLRSLQLNGGGGDDKILGSGFDDIISGGDGSDTMDGNGGANVVVDYENGEIVTNCAAVAVDWSANSGYLKVAAAPTSTGLDLKAIAASGDDLDIRLSGETVATIPRSAVKKLEIHGSKQADLIDCQFSLKVFDFVEIHGHAGDDTLGGTNGRDRFFGGLGNDIINGHSDTDYVIDFNQHDDNDSLANAKPLNLFLSWNAGDLSPSEWEAQVSTRPMLGLHPKGGSPPSDPLYLISKSGPGADNSINLTQLPLTQISFPIHYVVPKMSPDGSLVAFIRHYDSFRDHSMFCPRTPGSTLNLDKRDYCYANTRYRVEYVMEIPSAMDLTNLKNQSGGWVASMQLHPNNWGSQWGRDADHRRSQEAPISLRIRPNSGDPFMRVRVQGCPPGHYDDNGEPLGYPTAAGDGVTIFEEPLIVDEPVKVVLEFTLDFRGESGNAYVRFEMWRMEDNSLIGAGETRSTNGINRRPGSGFGLGSMLYTTGAYSSDFHPGESFPQIKYSEFKLYSENQGNEVP